MTDTHKEIEGIADTNIFNECGAIPGTAPCRLACSWQDPGCWVWHYVIPIQNRQLLYAALNLCQSNKKMANIHQKHYRKF